MRYIMVSSISVHPLTYVISSCLLDLVEECLLVEEWE